jgi:hypothetical protein
MHFLGWTEKTVKNLTQDNRCLVPRFEAGTLLIRESNVNQSTDTFRKTRFSRI